MNIALGRPLLGIRTSVLSVPGDWRVEPGLRRGEQSATNHWTKGRKRGYRVTIHACNRVGLPEAQILSRRNNAGPDVITKRTLGYTTVRHAFDDRRGRFQK